MSRYLAVSEPIKDTIEYSGGNFFLTFRNIFPDIFVYCDVVVEERILRHTECCLQDFVVLIGFEDLLLVQRRGMILQGRDNAKEFTHQILRYYSGSTQLRIGATSASGHQGTTPRVYFLKDDLRHAGFGL